MSQSQAQLVSHGVEDLIQRLRENGVNAGRRAAEEELHHAREQAAQLLTQAQNKAEAITQQARNDAQQLIDNAHAEISVALRDAILALRQELNQTFSDELAQQLNAKTAEKKLLETMILELAGKARKDAALDQQDNVVFVLPEATKDKKAKADGKLANYALSIAASALRKGVSFASSSNLQAGLHIKLEKSGMVVDLSDEALKALIAERISPKFYALLNDGEDA